MERLTTKLDGKGIIMLPPGVEHHWCISTRKFGDMTMQYLSGAAADRLAAYEETGLEPEALKKFGPFLDEMRKNLGAMRRLKELTEAERAGRLVVLPKEKTRWLKAILGERERQDQKWGFPQENTYGEWGSILAEEAGLSMRPQKPMGWKLCTRRPRRRGSEKRRSATMREILFRGKLTANGEWSYGCLKIFPDKTCAISPDDTVVGKYGRVDPATVGQYTGLNDAGGVKIFKDDVVAVKGEPFLSSAWAGHVIWSDTDSAFVVLPNDDENIETYCVGYYAKECHIRVIGNIHDNPELLKEEAEHG